MPYEHDDERRDPSVIVADLVILRERLRELVRVARDTIDQCASQRAAFQARRQRWQQRRIAAAADESARLADWYAGILEESADRGDAERRRAIARAEREVAAVERRNADRLRTGVAVSEMETPPTLPYW